MCGMGSPLQRKRGRGTGWVQQIRDGHACLNWAREQSVALAQTKRRARLPQLGPGRTAGAAALQLWHQCLESLHSSTTALTFGASVPGCRCSRGAACRLHRGTRGGPAGREGQVGGAKGEHAAAAGSTDRHRRTATRSFGGASAGALLPETCWLAARQTCLAELRAEAKDGAVVHLLDAQRHAAWRCLLQRRRRGRRRRHRWRRRADRPPGGPCAW